MRIEQGPMFRKIIVPWYDSKPVCLSAIAFLFLIVLFGIIGLLTAYENHEYISYMWVPLLVTFMSGFVIVSITTRLIKR